MVRLSDCWPAWRWRRRRRDVFGFLSGGATRGGRSRRCIANTPGRNPPDGDLSDVVSAPELPPWMGSGR